MRGRTQEGTGTAEEGSGDKKPDPESESGAVQIPALTSQSTEATAVAAEATAAKDSGPTREMAGSGRLAALLAERRASAGNAEKIDGGQIRVTPPHRERVTPPGGAFDAFEITAVGGSAGDRQTDLDRQKGSGAVRPTRVTPGSGRLAALLAQTRAESGKAVVLHAKATAAPTAPIASEPTPGSGAVSDEPEVTEVDAAAREGASDSKPESGQPSAASEPRPTRITPAGGGLSTLLEGARARIDQQEIHDRKTPLISSGDVLNVGGGRVVTVQSTEITECNREVSSAEKKNTGFVSTLLGVPAPVVDPSGPVDLAAARSVAAPGDTSEAATFGERVSVPVSLDDRPFRVDEDDVIRPSRRPRVVVGLVVGATIVVAAVFLIVPRNRTGPPPSSLTGPVPSRPAVVAGQSAPLGPTVESKVPGQPGEVPAVAAEQPAGVPVAAPDPRVAVPAAGAAGPTTVVPAAVSPAAVSVPVPTPAEQPAAKIEAKSEGNSADNIEGKSGARPAEASATDDIPSNEPEHRVGSRAQSREPEARRIGAKTRRKTQIIRATAEESGRETPVGAKVRQKANTSPGGRPIGEDPDAVLPLSRP